MSAHCADTVLGLGDSVVANSHDLTWRLEHAVAAKLQREMLRVISKVWPAIRDFIIFVMRQTDTFYTRIDSRIRRSF